MSKVNQPLTYHRYKIAYEILLVPMDNLNFEADLNTMSPASKLEQIMFPPEKKHKASIY